MTNSYFIIGDVQGQHALSNKLLYKVGLIDDDGNRLRPEVKVIQLGDLGHNARYHMGSQLITPEDDEKCYKLLEDKIIDIMLWGNHDRPMMRHLHRDEIFGGYVSPSLDLINRIESLRLQGKIVLAYAANEFLLTHAGLHSDWGNISTSTDPKDIANTLNEYDYFKFDGIGSYLNPVKQFIDTIGNVRGGYDPFGGIIWRDNNYEGLWDGVRQIYGHTAYETPQAQPSKFGDSYCIDVSKADRVAGIWLPSEEIVTVGNDDLIILDDKVDSDH
ncbi:unnamed protein product [Sphagnum balticum]